MPKPLGLIIADWIYGTEYLSAVYTCYEYPDDPRFPHLAMDLSQMALSMQPVTQRLSHGFCRFPDGHWKMLISWMCHLLAAQATVSILRWAYPAPDEDVLGEVQAVMRRIRTLKQAAKFRQTTSLQPVLRQDT
ncbi:hypothetical protein PHMEG_00030091 [Phytophthora megakarya]|uniref:Uncharacterized protein n=1 Tax=Phytophthora megakarya TaxID=4795 RepID=A0A225V1F5_9STRA|nr:hypothetical protein PHMEG_00030091 [Phytophthora megakarya]